MEILKVRLHQHTVVYRNPITAEVIETYPLPPPSTVIGWLYSMLGIMEPEKDAFNVSIQGEYEVMLRDYQWYKKYKENEFSERPYPILVHTLYNVSLIIHLYFLDQAFGEEIRRLIAVPPYFPFLGRAEDLVNVKEVKWVSCTKRAVENGFLTQPAYVADDQASALALRGVPYVLSGFYQYVPVTLGKGKRAETKTIRDFEWLHLQYVERGAYFESEEPIDIWQDEENDFIWWSMQNPIP